MREMGGGVRILTVVLAIMSVWVTSGRCDWYHWMSCGAAAFGDSVRVHVMVVGGTAFADQTVVVTASMLGSCASETIVTPAPLPIAAVDTPQEFSFTIRPGEPQRTYFYQAKLQDGNGNLTVAPGSAQYPNASYESCGDGLVTRGTLGFWPCPDPGLECLSVCPEQCWADCGDSVQLPADRSSWEGYLNTGQVLNFYGYLLGPWTPSTMPGTPCMVVTRIEEVSVPVECMEVPTESTNWGSVKASYR
jgi:hypothetical protein